jgi:hypothetical protein
MTRALLPPWSRFPGAEPTWSGWRQGVSEAWLVDTWLPFWQRLTEAERDAFLEASPPPSEEWREQLRSWAKRAAEPEGARSP